jgi:hypothetical protein
MPESLARTMDPNGRPEAFPTRPRLILEETARASAESGQTRIESWPLRRLRTEVVAWRPGAPMPLEFTTSYVEDAIAIFRQYKLLGDRAIAQCPDAKLTVPPDTDSNSVAILVKHMSGNMRSRWTDFLTTDGEKPDRNRDTEFEDPPATRAEVLAAWERGWAVVFSALASLTEADLARTITIRGEKHSVMQAINRQVAHYAYHTGQIVFLAKHYAGASWTTLSVPKKQSAQFNADVLAGKKSQRET